MSVENADAWERWRRWHEEQGQSILRFTTTFPEDGRWTEFAHSGDLDQPVRAILDPIWIDWCIRRGRCVFDVSADDGRYHLRTPLPAYEARLQDGTRLELDTTGRKQGLPGGWNYLAVTFKEVKSE